MSVRFIIGRAGSGKTRYCVEQIEELARKDPLGPPIFWLLPKQATFQAERELTCRLGAFSRVRVVSFDLLGKDILTDCGDIGMPEVTALGRKMVLGHLLRKHQDELLFYSASARRPGLAAELDSTFGEFERAGLDAPMLADVVKSLDNSADDPGSVLHDKLHDVQFLLNAYDTYIGQERFDQQKRLKLILDRVAACSLLKRATIFVDDFYDFTGYETKLLAAVAAVSSRTEIALLIDPESPVLRDPRTGPSDLSIFHRTERTYQSLHRALNEAGAKIEKPIVLKQSYRFQSEPLSLIERGLLDVAATPASHPDEESTQASQLQNIEFIEAPDARTEVDAIARRIRQSIREGIRLRDVAVLVRNIDDYQELIDASFSEHDLPYFVDRRRTAGHHPLLQFIRSALLIARHGWPHDAVMTLLKSGLAGVSEDDADELENYVLRHRIRGSFWACREPWGFRRELIGAGADEPLAVKLSETGRIDAARRGVVDNLLPFITAVRSTKPLKMREIITQLFAMLERFQIRKTMAAWIRDATLEQRGEHEQVWAELVTLFQHMAELLGDEPITLPDFIEVLDSGLESFDLALTPPTVDQILVGQIDRTRTPEVKLVLVLGLNEGQFPRVEREDCMLSDAERRLLRRRKIDLDPETDRQLLDERLLAYIALTRGSQQLVASRCLASDTGKPRNPSPFWTELRRLFPAVNVQQVPRPSQFDPNSIGTPRQLVTAMMRWVRNGGDTEHASPDSPWPALYQWLATYDHSDDSINTMRSLAWRALRYANTAQLSPELAAQLFPLPLEATVKRLETFAACPFQHFARYGLQLRDRDEPDVTAIDLSNAYHRVLEELLGEIIESKKDWCELEPKAAAVLIHTYTAEVGRTLRNELMLSTARNRYILERVERTLEQAVSAMCEANRRGFYRPAFAPLRFGGAGAKLAAHRVATPGGNELNLRGQIDRVDLHERGKAFTVGDYKLGVRPLQLDRIYHGLSLQLLTYIIVVQNAGQELLGRKLTPAAAFFLQLLRSPQSVDHPADALAPDDPDFHLRIKPRGLIDDRAINSLDRAVKDGSASSVFNIRVKQDGTLGWRNTSDVVNETEFAALLKHVEKRLGEIADRIVSGNISVEPYWINRGTPCSRCEFRSVCRFEPGINHYHIMPALRREDVLLKLTEVHTDGKCETSTARQWTDAQRQGIETVGKSLLVSAAAGSGKTSVLAERCVHLVCDADEPCGVDDLLVVTFTENAAAEMKERIHSALANRHARKPTDHTARQLAMFDRATVSTLHSFCSRLLRQHFHLPGLGLDPNFIILDADESALMKTDVARDLFAERYDAEDASDAFRKLVDSYADGNDERLVRQVIRAHETLCSVVDRAEWLNTARRQIAEAIELPLHKSYLGQEYIKTIKRHLDAMRAECADAGRAVKRLGRFPFYVEHLRDLYRALNHWRNVLDSHGLEAFVEEAANVELPKLPPVSNLVQGKDQAKPRVDSVRDAMKKGAWRQSLLFTSDEWKDGLRRIQPHVETFLSLVEDLSARYSAAKEEEGGSDFADLERLTLQALCDGNLKDLAPSAVARMYHRQFKHVLVDEYQDINEVQDAILTLISHECIARRGKPDAANLFCVGDVKQSIYRFRLAELRQFQRRRDDYSKQGSHGIVVDLQSNFRSRAPLLQAINAVFEKLMTAEAADLSYDASQRLNPEAKFPQAENERPSFNGAPIELHLLPKGAASSSVDEDSEDIDLDRSQREATLLARRILEMTGKRGQEPMQVFDRGSGKYRQIRFGDIVILLRSMRFKADQFADELRQAGIRVHSESATGYFEATEVNDVLALLKVLDNQRQDIPLAAVLRSPFASIAKIEDQLARIRLAYPGDPPVAFNEAVARYAAEQTDALATRLRNFRAQLDAWRRLARQRPLAEVLWTIYSQTGYLAFCAGLPGGEQRQANLIELHERARQFGTFHRQGLSRFLEFLEKLKSESDLGQASIASEAEDVVKIMSIHRSKGLEFPVVLLPDLGKAFNLQDTAGSILLDRQAGIGFQVVDEERRVKYPSLAYTVVQQRIRQQTLAEEMRVLYVAMTRAKEHLILVGTARDEAEEKWTTHWTGHEGPLPTEEILGARSMLDWLGPTAAVLAGRETDFFRVESHSADEILEWSQEQQTTSELSPTQEAMAALKPLDPAPPESKTARDVIERIGSPYAFKAFTELAASASVTSRTKSASTSTVAATPASPLRQEATQASQLQEIEPDATTLDRILAKPAFLAGELPPDAADRGTATHAVLERLDFAQANDATAIRRQIASIVERRHLTAAQSKLVDIEAILWLMQDEVGRLLRENANGLFREVPIYLAAEPTPASIDPLDQAMIRGRIDLLVPVGDGYVIVDYKTDRVSGDALEERAAMYAAQLKLYRDAIQRITSKPVTQAVIVFLDARECRSV